MEGHVSISRPYLGNMLMYLIISPFVRCNISFFNFAPRSENMSMKIGFHRTYVTSFFSADTKETFSRNSSLFQKKIWPMDHSEGVSESEKLCLVSVLKICLRNFTGNNFWNRILFKLLIFIRCNKLDQLKLQLEQLGNWNICRNIQIHKNYYYEAFSLIKK